MAITTNLSLNLPTVTVTLGPTWANQINAAFEVIDEHDHSSGKGVQIPTAGLNINADLDFGSYRATALMSTQFTSQASSLTGALNANSVYVVSGDLYFTNSAGSAIQITSGGAIASSPGNAQIFEYQGVAADLNINSSDTFVYLAVDTTAARNITLPLASAVSAGRIYVVKDVSGESLDNNITITASGSDNVDGASTQTLNSNYGSWTIVGDGSSNWYIS